MAQSSNSPYALAAQAAGAAIVLNLIIFYVASALGAMPQSVLSPAGMPVNASAVIGASITGSIGALIAFLLFRKLIKKVPNPKREFTFVAALVLVLSLYEPFTIVGAPSGMIAALMLMHIVTGGLLIERLNRAW